MENQGRLVWLVPWTPCSLRTQAQYKSNNHLTGGKIYCTVEKRGSDAKLGFLGKPGFLGVPTSALYRQEPVLPCLPIPCKWACPESRGGASSSGCGGSGSAESEAVCRGGQEVRRPWTRVLKGASRHHRPLHKARAPAHGGGGWGAPSGGAWPIRMCSHFKPTTGTARSRQTNSKDPQIHLSAYGRSMRERIIWM